MAKNPPELNHELLDRLEPGELSMSLPIAKRVGRLIMPVPEKTHPLVLKIEGQTRPPERISLRIEDDEYGPVPVQVKERWAGRLRERWSSSAFKRPLDEVALVRSADGKWLLEGDSETEKDSLIEDMFIYTELWRKIGIFAWDKQKKAAAQAERETRRHEAA